MKLTKLGAVAAATIALGSTAAGAHGLSAAPIHAWNIAPVVTHLNEPRGLSFDRSGNLYVAEAGIPGPGTTGVTHTGAVSKYRWTGGTFARAWSTAFTSLYMPSEGGGGGSDVLGPAGVSATGTNCGGHTGDTRGGEHSRRHCVIQVILSESRRQVKAETGLDAPQLGHLFDLSAASGAARSRADVGDRDYAWTAHHVDLFPDDFPDANPYAVVTIKGHSRSDDRGRRSGRARSRTFVADAASNTISEVLRGGRSKVISYIPNESSGAKRDATPTCIAQGPDGALYVGALDLLSNFAIGPGQSNVWRVDSNSTQWRHNATLWATGFTTINGCAFDHRGDFWASELFYPNSAGPPGDLAYARFAHPDVITHVGGGQIPLPGGVAEGPDGAMYVGAGSADTTPGSGAVIRVGRD